MSAASGPRVRDAQYRPHGRRGDAVHRFLRRLVRVHAVAGRPDDRLLSAARRPAATCSGPMRKIGISDGETTIAQMLKPLGYATACFGKWHLGHLPQFLPTHHGFDEYFGLPYSNDMWPKHPENPEGLSRPAAGRGRPRRRLRPRPDATDDLVHRAGRALHREEQGPAVLPVRAALDGATCRCTSRTSSRANRSGASSATSSWRSTGPSARSSTRSNASASTRTRWSCSARTTARGSATASTPARPEPLREGKGTTFDGGQREPTILRWPGKIPAGQVCREPATTMDMLPTIAGLAGAKLPDHKIDGKDIWPLVSGQAGRQEPARSVLLLSGLGPRSGPQRQMEAALPARLPHARRPSRRHGRQARQVRAGQDRPGPLRPGERHRRAAQRRRPASGRGQAAPATRRRDASGPRRRAKEWKAQADGPPGKV